MSVSGLVMSEDALVGGEDEMSELPGWQDVVGPLLKIADEDIVARRDDSTLVDAANQLDHNLLGSVVIDDLKLSNVVVFLHNLQEFEEDL